MERLLLDCVEGVYIIKFGHLNLVLTQDIVEAERIGKLYTGHEVHPQWWIEAVPIVQKNFKNIVDAAVQLECKLGRSSMEFCNVMGDHFTMSGFSI